GPRGPDNTHPASFNARPAARGRGTTSGVARGVPPRRFKRLLAEAPRAAGLAEPSAAFAADPAVAAIDPALLADEHEQADHADHPWPGLGLIDGGQGQLAAARVSLGGLGVTDPPLVSSAQGAHPGGAGGRLDIP